MRTPVRAAALAGLLALGLSACLHRVPGADARVFAVRASLADEPAAFCNSATIYFVLTDRFANGDTSNDHALGRAHDGAVLRSFEGGDFAGVLQKIEAGYFDSLGVDALWLTPFVEQIHGSVDEGMGKTYGYHGYWARDWTAVDPALGTKEDLRALVDTAHRHGIRVLMDAVINHTGPATSEDPPWPEDWVRTGPNCTFRSYVTTVTCTLVATLPDIRTESDASVELPPWLAQKWRQEGRLDRERASLDSFFTHTGYPRAPRYYFIKWLTDWVRDFGFDGYRMDTAKHFGEDVSAELKREAELAFAAWKRSHPSQVLDSLPFYMVGEVYGWEPSQGREYDFGDRKVDFFTHGYDGLINFGFKREAAGSLDSVFTRYSAALHEGPLRGRAFLNYMSSHDDGSPYDIDRKDPLGTGTRLLLAPGGAQIYYGDETARPLRVAGAQGDANLRSFMNWPSLEHDSATGRFLEHWRKLGQFRRLHPAVGAGTHRRLQANPYIFSRSLDTETLHDRVIVAMGLQPGTRTISAVGVLPDGTQLVDAYSGERTTVQNGMVSVTSRFGLVLLGAAGGPQLAGGSVRLEVTNNYVLPVEVYAYGAGTSYHVGTVHPGIVSRFVIRDAMLAAGGVVEFVAEPADRRPPVSSGQMLLKRGETVDFVIATHLIGSTATVRP